MVEELHNFRYDYRNVDLHLADNGLFLPKLNELENKARNKFILARKAEIAKENDGELYMLYQEAYNQYSELIQFLEQSANAVLFASTHSKRQSLVNIVSIFIGLNGLVPNERLSKFWGWFLWENILIRVP